MTQHDTAARIQRAQGVAKARNRHGDLHHVDTPHSEVVLPHYQLNLEALRRLEGLQRLVQARHMSNGDALQMMQDQRRDLVVTDR